MPSYLVTGASRGLGYGWITHLAADPSNTVFALVRNKSATEERLGKDGLTDVHVLTADITDIEALQAAADAVSTITAGRLDVLIHNAALVSDRSAFLTVLDDRPQDLASDLIDSFQANVVGTAHVLTTFLPLIRQGHEKKIMVTSSGMADPDLVKDFHVAIATPYAVSKAATNMLVTKFHAAVGLSEGIVVFAMSPGLVDTREGKAMTEADAKGAQAMVAQFAEYAPDFKGPITPRESVQMQLEVIHRATVAEFGGAFVSQYGNKQWL